MSRSTVAGPAWALPGTALVLLGLALVLEVLNGRQSGEETLQTSAQAIVALTFASVGALVVHRQPGNAVGWIFGAVGLLQALNVSGYAYAQYTVVTRPGFLAGGEVSAWSTAWTWIPSLALLTTFLLLLFPDGRLPSRRWRGAAWLIGGGIGLAVVSAGVALWPERRDIAFGVEVSPVGGASILLALAGVTLVPLAIACAVSVVLRFRRARGEERQQLKWFTYAAGLAVAGVAVLFIGTGNAALAALLFGFGFVGLLAVPVATGIAILRYRLYDIDVVINRTLVYGLLSALLAGTYLGLVLLLQLLLNPLTSDNALAVAGSTVAVAALFRPARSRIQAAVDRRFYRRRYDAARTLEGFSARLRDEIDLHTLSAELRAVIRETMQPAHVSVWLREARR